MKRTLPRELDDLSGMRAATMVPRVHGRPVGQLRTRRPARAAGPGHRTLRPRRCRPGVVGGLVGLDLGLAHRHVGDDDLHGPGWRLRRPRRGLRLPLPAEPQADAHRGRGPSPYRRGRRPLRRRTAALSSDPSSWDQFIREAHEAEAYSRKLSKRVSEGYAAKRRRLGVPGGNKMPYGIIREGKPSVLRVDEEKARGRHPRLPARRHRLDRLGGGRPDRSRQDPRVSEVLTNPIYAGRLRTGEPAAIAPIVDPSLWSTVQTRRERRRTRTPGRIVKGRYALRLCCAGCGKYLFGDVGRYRHPPPTCEGFLAAKPVVRCRRARNREGIDTRIKGHSYPQEWYEDAVG